MNQGGIFQLILSLLAGSGFQKVADSISKLTQSGADVQQLFSSPNMPLLMAGAGIKDVGNSMELVGPFMKMLQPPKPPEGPKPQETQAAMQMLGARLGPGLTGLRPPGMGMPGGMQPPGAY